MRIFIQLFASAALLAMPVVASAAPIDVGQFSVPYPTNVVASYLEDGEGNPIETIAQFKGGAGFARTVWAEEHALLSLEEGVTILKRYCDADGVGSARCTAGRLSRTFKNKHGLSVGEIVLMLEVSIPGEKVQRRRVYGYAVIDGRHKGLLVHSIYTESVVRGESKRLARQLATGASVGN